MKKVKKKTKKRKKDFSTFLATEPLERMTRFSRKAVWTQSSWESLEVRRTVSIPQDRRSFPRRCTIVSQTKRILDGGTEGKEADRTLFICAKDTKSNFRCIETFGVSSELNNVSFLQGSVVT